ncbi:MAG: hypothetical protein IJ334_01655 [Clostridia bacterium]|nr:hypothetical protein [Clostridia bacterium]
MKIILGIILAIILLALILFPEVRKKLKVLVGGFLNVFVEDAAKTPEGAAAIFTEAIEEIRAKYNRASDTLNKLSGELKHAEDAAKILENKIKEAEAACENLVRNGKMKEAEIYAESRSELMTELAQKRECIARLKPMVADATQIYDTLGKKLRETQRLKKETVNGMRMNDQLKDILGDLDELKKDTATKKLLDSVMEGSSDLKKEVDGARIVHENRTSTKVERAEQQAAKLANDEYLENLKKKYGGSK